MSVTAVNPFASEVCNGADDDCDGLVDGADDSLDVATTSAFYADADADGYGAGDPVAACSAPSGTVSNAEDCDDASPEVNPAATEICDGIDDDCDGAVDDADSSLDLATTGVYYTDADDDGYGAGSAVRTCSEPDGTVILDGDCDDSDHALSPSAVESCDGIDDDCDGLVDDADPDVAATTTWNLDRDGDGFGGGRFEWTSCEAPLGYVADATDCDDARADVSPAGTEVCDARDVDEDCDGLSDDADPSVDPAGQSERYADADGDGFGDAATAALTCEARAGTTVDATDCDDSNAAVSPDGTEACDDVDNDCDGLVDWGHRVPSDYAGVQEAVDAVADGDTVCVEAGTYAGGLDIEDRSVTIQGTYGSAVTTLDGGGEGSVVYLSGDAGTGSALVGLTVTGGGGDVGTGMWLDYANVALRDVVITGNTCDSFGCEGVGMYAEYSTVTLDQVDIRGNVATAWFAYGAGAYFYASDATVTDTHFDGNQTDVTYLAVGTGVELEESTVSFTDVTIDDNASVASGASSYIYGALNLTSGTLEAYGLSVSGNTATGFGVAAGGYFEGDQVTLANAAFIANESDATYVDAAGAEFYGDSDLTNVIVAGNRATGEGVTTAGLLLGYYTYDLENVTIVGNAVTATGTDGEMVTYAAGLVSLYGESTLNNVTVTGNTVTSAGTVETGGVYFDPDDDVVTYVNSWGNDVSDWSTDVTGVDGNLSVDPLYTDITSSDPTAWDLTLQAGSPLIDVGDPAILDADGSQSDIGAWGGPGASDW